jgi:hypothetical protein
MAEARIDMSAADRNVLTLIQQISGGFDKIVASMERTEKRSASLQQSTDRMFSSIGSGVRGFAADVGRLAIGLAGIQSAGAMIMAEYDKFKQKLANSAQVGTTFAGSIAAATRNAPEGMSGLQIEHMARNAAQAAGIEPTQVAAAMPGMFAAGGSGISAERYAQIAVAAGPLSFGSPADYSANAAGAAGYMATAGKAGEGLSAQQVLGFMQQASAGSVVDQMSVYGPLVGSVHASAAAKGFDLPESTAMFNALTRATKDSAGASSRTANIQLMTALDHARKALGMPAEASPKKIIAELQKPENAKARAVFLRELKGEQSHIDVMRSVITPGSVGDQFMRQGFAGTPSMAGGQAAYEAAVGNIASAPSVGALMPAAAISGEAQGLVLDPKRIEAGAVRAAFEQYNAAGNGLAISDAIDMLGFDAHVAQGGDATDYVRGKLQSRVQQLRNPTESVGEGWGAEAAMTTRPRAPTQQEVKLAESIERLIQTMNRVDKTLETNRPQVAPNGERPALPGGRN